MGNKVRQFTGMTEPLTLTVSEAADAADDADTFSYAGKTYGITISGRKKSDDIRETKYENDGKNQLAAYTDPEGRRETYTYNAYGDVATQDDTSFVQNGF